MTKAVKVQLPVAPNVPVTLATQDVDVESDMEIDEAWVENIDFASATRVIIAASHLLRAAFTGLSLDKLEMTDVVCDKAEGAALGAYKANLLRVSMADCRFIGAEFAEGHFEDCTFRNIKFDEAGFRFATFKRVRFDGCILRQADFTNAKLTHVTFDNCDLDGTNFVSAHCGAVDVSGESLAQVRGLLGLKGATISAEQLIQLAPLLASELGFHVKE